MAQKPTAPEMLLPVATASYPTLFVPRAYKDNAPKFSIVCIWPPAMVAKLKEVKEEAGKLLLAVYGAVWIDAVKAGQLYWPFKPITGLKVKDGYPEGGVMATLSANADSPPPVYSRYRDPRTGKARIITDPKEIYAGCQVIVLAKPYLFGQTQDAPQKGVTLGLQAVQLYGDGPRLDGRRDPTDKFRAEEEPAAALPSAAAGTAQTEDTLTDMLGGASL